MVEEIGGDAAGIVPVLAPAEVALGIERPLRGRAEEGFPVERLLGGLGVDGVVPLPALIPVAPEAAGRPHHLAEQAVGDRLLGLPEVIHRGVLAADLEHAAGRFHHLGDLLRLLDRVGHRLFEVDVLAVAQRLHRVGVMPVIGRGNHHDVDVGPGADLAIVVVDGPLVDAGGFAGPLLALVPDVVDGDRLNVTGLLAALHHPADVGVHPAAAADEADVDAIVRADHPALRRGRGLACGGGRSPADADRPAARRHPPAG